MTTALAAGGAGALVRDWRQRRRRSQLDLALETGVSTRHLSFVETGRARPSPELLLALADQLEIPLRDRNALLLAAGYAPRYGETGLDDPAMTAVRAALQRMLTLHDPYPAVVIGQNWDVMQANEAAGRLVAALPPALAGPPLNVFRACLHPEGLAAATLNFPEWAGYLLGQLSPAAAADRGPGRGRAGRGGGPVPERRRAGGLARRGARGRRAGRAGAVAGPAARGGAVPVHHADHVRRAPGRHGGGGRGRVVLAG